jgi:hypothetical protein
MKNVDIKTKSTTPVKGEKKTEVSKERRIAADKLFSLFTASIIKKRTKFTR